MKNKMPKLLIAASLLLGVGILSSCDKTPSSSTPTSTSQPVQSEEKIDVSELSLELSKVNAKVGEIITVNVKVKPSNATNKEFTLSSSDTTIAKIVDNKIECLAKGTVTITARSKANPSKKSEAKLVVLGADEEGRYENIFEAEEANLVKAENSSMGIEAVDDDRLSGTGVVGKISKGDRIIWGIEAIENDNDAILKFKMMGPSGWLGMWDSIDYTFADFYTVKVNGKVINTENIHVEGTLNRGGSADYYNVKEVTIGKISLNKGLNVVTLVLSNRFDQTTISNENYNGTLSCLGNIDSMTILSKTDLTYKENTQEVTNPEDDVILQNKKFEVEDSLTRIYKDEENPQINISPKTAVELEKGMIISYGFTASENTKAKLGFNITAPYKNTETKNEDVKLSDLVTITINKKQINLQNLTLKGGENNLVYTDWLDLIKDTSYTLTINVKQNAEFEYLGSFDYLNISYLKGELTPFLASKPSTIKEYKFEAEAPTTKRIGYDALNNDATFVEFKAPKKVQEETYNNKLETTKIIYGIESSEESFATIKMRVAAPYIDTNTTMEDVSLGNIGDLWVNGKLILTPNTLKGNSLKGTKENFTTVEIETQISLKAGKNRIAFEPQNYTDNEYTYLGGLDYIELSTSSTLTAYEVNMWTDRYTYFDDANNEPIYVTCDKVNEANPNNCWIGLFKQEDSIEVNNPGSLYFYYPTNSSYNSDGKSYLNEACDITKQNPNNKRPLISGETGGYYCIVYMEWDSHNSTKGYNIADIIYISVWNDPDNYGGRK